MPVTKLVGMRFRCDRCGAVMEAIKPTQRECERHARHEGWTYNMGSLGGNPFCSCGRCREEWKAGRWPFARMSEEAERITREIEDALGK